jgi:hypothetical protein
MLVQMEVWMLWLVLQLLTVSLASNRCARPCSYSSGPTWWRLLVSPALQSYFRSGPWILHLCLSTASRVFRNRKLLFCGWVSLLSWPLKKQLTFQTKGLMLLMWRQPFIQHLFSENTITVGPINTCLWGVDTFGDGVGHVCGKCTRRSWGQNSWFQGAWRWCPSSISRTDAGRQWALPNLPSHQGLCPSHQGLCPRASCAPVTEKVGHNQLALTGCGWKKLFGECSPGTEGCFCNSGPGTDTLTKKQFIYRCPKLFHFQLQWSFQSQPPEGGGEHEHLLASGRNVYFPVFIFVFNIYT